MGKTFKEMKIEEISRELTEVISKQFDLIKEDYNLSYGNDFKVFALGYTIGACGTIKQTK